MSRFGGTEYKSCRGVTRHRRKGNFVAIEIKVNATPAEADEDFASLVLLKEKLDYPLTIFLNLGAAHSHAERCPKCIAAQTVCFAVVPVGDAVSVIVERCS